MTAPAGRTPGGGRVPYGCATAGARPSGTCQRPDDGRPAHLPRRAARHRDACSTPARVATTRRCSRARIGSARAVVEAVAALVFKPHWHIVRLRVVAGGVLADVGGPEVPAPVSGSLRAHGRTLGRYVLSVQDDLGYVKLVTRFIGAPIDLYRNGSAVMGTLLPGAARADQGDVRGRGRAYVVSNWRSGASLRGTAGRAVRPAGARADELRGAAHSPRGAASPVTSKRGCIRRRPLRDLASVVRAVTGGRVLRSLRRRAVSSAAGRGGCRLRRRSLRRARWPVYSWQPAAGARIYFLAPSVTSTCQRRAVSIPSARRSGSRASSR